MTKKTAEQLRLEAQFPEGEGWKKWGPYLSERQWGTVREDYSPHGNAWDYFPHDHARRRGIGQPEYELVDTDLFTDNRYFDVFVEYAQAGVDDILLRITVENRGPEPAPIHLLPQLWFRNTWSWKPNRRKPVLSLSGPSAIQAEHAKLGTYFLYADDNPADF